MMPLANIFFDHMAEMSCEEGLKLKNLVNHRTMALDNNLWITCRGKTD